jgi:hypothetical protein
VGDGGEIDPGLTERTTGRSLGHGLPLSAIT